MSIALPGTSRGDSEVSYQRIDRNPECSGLSEQRAATEVDLNAIKGAVRTILRAVGEDPDRDGLLETPGRVAKMYAEMFGGLHLDPGRHLEVTFAESYDEIVLVRDIEYCDQFDARQFSNRHGQSSRAHVFDQSAGLNGVSSHATGDLE